MEERSGEEENGSVVVVLLLASALSHHILFVGPNFIYLFQGDASSSKWKYTDHRLYNLFPHDIVRGYKEIGVESFFFRG